MEAKLKSTRYLTGKIPRSLPRGMLQFLFCTLEPFLRHCRNAVTIKSLCQFLKMIDIKDVIGRLFGYVGILISDQAGCQGALTSDVLDRAKALGMQLARSVK